jgi:ribosomal protein L40E
MICKENREVFVKLDLYRYLNTDVTAINVDLEFTNIFGDMWVVKDISCLDFDSDGMVLHTKEQRIMMDFEKTRSVKSVRVIIKKYISNNNTVTCINESKEITLSDNELSTLRYLAGVNAVTPYADTESGWTCVCGTENDQDITECTLCGKPRQQDMDSGAGDLNRLLQKLESVSSAYEMKVYLVEYNANYNSERLAHLIVEVDKIAQIERLYGNRKLEALSVIKKELDVNLPAEKSKVIDETAGKEFCYKCGASTVPNTKFCQRCGAPKITG